MSTQQTTRPRVDVAAFVAGRVNALQEGYLRDDARAVGDLARLRRGVAIPPGRDIELTGLAIGGLYDEDARLPDAPTAVEHAAYAAVTLYALHQQSQRGGRMHQAGYSFGRSARLLGTRAGADEAVRRRFTALGTATSWEETMHHARGLIQQFRAHDIPLDYARFARDLLFLRSNATADRVRNAWGRDFYRIKPVGRPEDAADSGAGEDDPVAPELDD